MIIVPLTQAALRLAVDAKTLRRWLADAQLPLHPNPQDARTKGVLLEHLHLLAQQHQRHLTPAPPEPSAQEAPSAVPLPAAVLALPETLQALQAQITALHQQVATLTQLLQQPPAPPLTSPASPQKTHTLSASAAASRRRAVTAPASPQKTHTLSARATPPIPNPRPVAKKAPSKPVHVIPRVEYRADGHYVVICPKNGLLSLEPDSPAWFAWVKEQSSFRFVGRSSHFTAHHEWTTPRGAWRAHRQIRNHSYNVRLAPNQHLTIVVLEQAAETLQAHLL